VSYQPTLFKKFKGYSYDKFLITTMTELVYRVSLAIWDSDNVTLLPPDSSEHTPP